MLWKSSCNSVFEQDKNNYVFKLIKGVHGPCPDDELAHPEGNYQFKERSEVKSPVLEIGKYVWSADIETIADELIHAKMFYIFQVHGGKNTVGLSFNKSSIPAPVFAETREALSVSIPRTSSICDFILSGSEEGRSILFRTGKIS